MSPWPCRDLGTFAPTDQVFTELGHVDVTFLNARIGYALRHQSCRPHSDGARDLARSEILDSRSRLVPPLTQTRTYQIGIGGVAPPAQTSTYPSSRTPSITVEPTFRCRGR